MRESSFNTKGDLDVRTIPGELVESVVDTLHEAFHDYPVMRFVLGPDVAHFDDMHARLIRLFVMGRVLSNDPVFGIGDPNHLEAVATVTLPQPKGIPEELTEYRKAAWARFGSEAKARYDVLCEIWGQLDIEEPQYHLNMIGVRNAHQGKGHGRRLVEHVTRISDCDPESNGVSLTTEFAANVPFYERLGFEVTGYAEVAPGLETWNFFRRKT